MITITRADGTAVTMSEDQFRAERGEAKIDLKSMTFFRRRTKPYRPQGNGVDARFNARRSAR